MENKEYFFYTECGNKQIPSWIPSKKLKSIKGELKVRIPVMCRFNDAKILMFDGCAFQHKGKGYYNPLEKTDLEIQFIIDYYKDNDNEIEFLKYRRLNYNIFMVESETFLKIEDGFDWLSERVINNLTNNEGKDNEK